MDKQVIGLREWISLPEWGIEGVRAKADTGARTSAIDVENVVELEGNRVQFEIGWHGGAKGRKTLVASVSRRSHVKSSTGNGAERLFVRTTIVIGKIRKEAEFSLVCRKDMIHRILLGREVLRDHFLVDPSAKFLLTSHPMPRRGTS